ncbi:MAG: PDZ domain-containing protein, partial [Acidimicrobiia bacterium]|nr:PDZ domain-containing protein [Acidimicrobiia bacterium]
LESTVTAGIISAVDRTNCTDGELCLSMLQTDAAINPGNSGGALVNRYGEVVGINVSIFSQSGSNEGVGFALPSETVINYVDDIVAGRPLETAFLGVRGGFSPGDRAGALITAVDPGTGAEEAGLMVEDVVISLDGVIVQGIDDLAAQVRAHRPGDTVTLVLIRDGVEMSINVTLGVRPPSG